MPWCARGCGPSWSCRITRPRLAIEVVGEAADGAQAADQARRLQPDIVLLDPAMPVMGGIEAIPRIVEGKPRSRVIILTSFGEEDRLLPAIRAGVQGLSPERHPSE